MTTETARITNHHKQDGCQDAVFLGLGTAPVEIKTCRCKVPNWGSTLATLGTSKIWPNMHVS